MKLRTLGTGLSIIAATLATGGCHELQPHRLQRMNRGPGLSPEVYYSIPDPTAELRGFAADAWERPAPPAQPVHSVASDEPVGATSTQPSGDFATE